MSKTFKIEFVYASFHEMLLYTRMCKVFNFVVLAILLPVASLEAQETFDYAYTAPESYEAAFRLRLPTSRIDYVLVLVPGYNGDGRGMVNDPAWQKFANEYHCAIVGCKLVRKDGGSLYEVVDYWSGEALLNALKHFSRRVGKPKIATAPLLLWGYSSGGVYSYNIANWKPNRVAGVVSVKSAYNTNDASDDMLKVPVLLIGGEKDDDRTDVIKHRFSVARPFGKLWCFAVEAESGHEIGKSAMLGREFLRATIEYHKAMASNANSDASWCGDLNTHKIFPHAKQSIESTVWLPSESFAKAWQTFVGSEKTAK